jgi:DNA adenine methylase
MTTRPILKWAGGKGQLLEAIDARLPQELRAGKITRFVEPFIGGGAVFFHVAQKYDVREFYLSDLNEELIVLYTAVRRDVEKVIALLSRIAKKYSSLERDTQKDFFYAERERFNIQLSTLRSGSGQAFNFKTFQPNWIERAAQIIFLNRTCYNGLFRVNAKGGFNVPFGDYKNPTICDEGNLRAASALLQRAQIAHTDFTACAGVVDRDTFVYFDPPYRPISRTASFKSYSRHDFNDEDQKRLAGFYRQMDARGAKLMLSNSDPQNGDPGDNFFDDLYSGFRVDRIQATRNINSNGERRGRITELLITNY